MQLRIFLIRLLQLALVGLFIMGLFAVGFFVFVLTFGVIAILGIVYWLRGKGILSSPDSPSFSENGAEYYMETSETIIKTHTKDSATVIDAEFQEIDKK
jgi:membrane-bound ClpP family serine protease